MLGGRGSRCSPGAPSVDEGHYVVPRHVDLHAHPVGSSGSQVFDESDDAIDGIVIRLPPRITWNDRQDVIARSFPTSSGHCHVGTRTPPAARRPSARVSWQGASREMRGIPAPPWWEGGSGQRCGRRRRWAGPASDWLDPEGWKQWRTILTRLPRPATPSIALFDVPPQRSAIQHGVEPEPVSWTKPPGPGRCCHRHLQMPPGSSPLGRSRTNTGPVRRRVAIQPIYGSKKNQLVGTILNVASSFAEAGLTPRDST